MSVKGVVFNIQRYSIDDGPGIRTTVFLKGCPLRCLWCSNPESQMPWPEVTHRDVSCTKCGRCVEECPQKAISVDGSGVHINRETCVRCFKCVSVCTPEALRVSGKEMSVEEVMQEIKKDADYYTNSGGGVTASGGEALMQADFVAELFRQCRSEGIHTCLDTSGYADASAVQKVLPYTDLVYFDMKHVDPAAHKVLTGYSNDLIVKNLKLFVDGGVTVVIRIPVIPGCNDGDDVMTGIAGTVAAISRDVKINLLPYHRYGTGKYKMMDMEYKLEAAEPPAGEKMERLKKIFENFGFTCEIVI